ncbi:Serpentine receptor class gamma [Caenorhabditis elegans]|uniref:Serpentine receptor class gamma n=1 Tax=Caenorhabditis elegans TaxID=6239 RepID=Q9TYR7_CAEEL|nr:Serpentine receptor class gamma [Caenorhabditis elegans]CCD63385.2 Serpentine receptor class gamma [Caenorhabditis elegans]|eukprot:NP_500878.3 Serpentine Receptor, class V [Caenorhabditis elegans]
MFKTTFYTILIQHCLADIFALIFYTSKRFAYAVIPYFVYKHQDFGFAAVAYDGVFWFIIIRCYGITLLTVHRYCIIAKPFMQSLKPWKIVFLYWIPSTIFCIIFYSSTEIKYESPERMVYVMNPNIIKKSTKTAFVFVIISCLICLIFYSLIWKFIKTRSQTVLISLQREIRLAFQVCLSFVAQLILLLYLASSYYSGEIEDMELIVLTRKYFPLVYGTLSFIGPFTILIFNNDVFRKVRFMIFGKKWKTRIEVSVVTTTKRTTVFQIAGN